MKVVLVPPHQHIFKWCVLPVQARIVPEGELPDDQVMYYEYTVERQSDLAHSVLPDSIGRRDFAITFYERPS